MLKKITDFIREIGAGYFRFFKWLAVVLIFVGLLILFNYITILPLRTLAVNYRLVYNSITITIIALLLLIGIVRLVIRTGWRQCLIFFLFLVVLFGLFILPEKLSFVFTLATIPYLILLYPVKVRKILSPGMIILLIFLCYIMGLYRIAVLFFMQWFFLAIPAAIFYLLFLGYILYEKRIHSSNKLFM